MLTKLERRNELGAPITDIGPSATLNRLFALLLCLIALPFLAFAVVFIQDHGWEDWMIPAVPAAIGLVLVAIAVRALKRPPMNEAHIRFRDGGFKLDTKQVFRGEKSFDLDWADINEVTKHDGGLYGGRSIRIWYGSQGQYAMFVPLWTDATTLQILERLEASANAAGFTFEKLGGFWSSLIRERWVVHQKV